MGFLQTLGAGQGYLKAGFLGMAGSGKTRTSVELACGIRDYLKLDGPVAMYDTEGGSEYIAALVQQRTGKALLGHRSRSLADLIAMTRECEEQGVSALIVDSITHVWREVGEAYLKQTNDALARKNKPKKIRMEFQDWAQIKAKWAEWPDLYLNSKLHIIICGRAGFEWDFETREDGTKELIKTGTKMKVESEFGFEPSLLVEMEKFQIRDGENKLTKAFVRKATVLKDRFDVIDGNSADNPTFEFFQPHVALLTPGAHAPVDVVPNTDLGVDSSAEDAYQRERRDRVILCERVQAAMLERWPGQTAADKKAKVDALKAAFGTTSWTEVETRRSAAQLREGLHAIEGIAPANSEVA